MVNQVRPLEYEEAKRTGRKKIRKKPKKNFEHFVNK